MSPLSFYIGAVLLPLWDAAYLVPIKSVVAAFGDINKDIRNIITMEWIIENMALIIVSVLVTAVTFVDPFNAISIVVYILVMAAWLALAAMVSSTVLELNTYHSERVRMHLRR